MKNKIKRILAFIIVIAFIGTSVVFFIDFKVRTEGKKYIVNPKDVPEAEVILVLGAYVKPNGNLCDMLQDRVDVGIDLYKNNKAKKLLFSGDHGQVNYDEVNAMKKVAEKKGVKKEDIFLDHAGFSTYESMYRAKEIFKAKKIIIVTQEYHLMRAVYIARQLGLDAYGVNSDPRNYWGIGRYKTREIAARVKDYFNVNMIKSKPKYLGDAIPVSGNGIVTHDK
ncbi:SanA/YdcF family protein [Clostridium lundense]|uniref:SanA/YdcF family protein n=1 Tax=Clostridium lundense TaxID=319475 RepID=UPI0004846F00|nr:ElyC/SanA/YdcF family protein [Clostridium lundense]